MRLRDEVDVLRAGEHEDDFGNGIMPDWYNGVTTVASAVPAEVVFTTVATYNDDGRNALIEELRAVVEPMDFDPVWNRLRWRGEVYMTDGPPMIRRRNGTDHHLTIPLKQVNG